MTDDPVALLAALRGIGTCYHDHRGELQEIGPETRRGILGGMGIVADDPASVARAIEAASRLNAGQMLPPVVVWRDGELALDAALPPAVGPSVLRCAIEFEGGGEDHWEVQQRGTSARLTRAGRLPQGYHRFRVTAGADDSAETLLVVTPERCHEPQALAGEARRWGLAVQLYTLRSATNWGIGDFADLVQLARDAAAVGADFIGLNPLHALFAANPAHCSPYSPSSRHMLNVLYIAVESLPDFADCPEARARVAQPAFQAELARLCNAPLVEYAGVAALKFEILGMLHTRFRREEINRNTGRARAFAAFRAARGRSLELHALFEALDETLRSGHDAHGGWPSWPEAYRDPAGPAVAEFARQSAERIEFHAWLQWLAESQLVTLFRGQAGHGEGSPARGASVPIPGLPTVGGTKTSAALLRLDQNMDLDAGDGSTGLIHDRAAQAAGRCQSDGWSAARRRRDRSQRV